MAVRTKTRRRIQILILGALALSLLGAGGYLLRKRQVAAQILSERDIGYAALEDGDHFTALHKIGPYLQRHPDDPDALHKYARARMNVEEPNGKHLADAMSLYRRLLELQPDNDAAREQLLDLYLRVNFNAEVLTRTEGRDDAVSLRTCAVALVRTGRTTDALRKSKRYNELKPSDLRMQVVTLQLMLSEGEAPDTVLKHAAALQEDHPNDPSFELLRGNAFALVQNREDALEWTQKAVARRLEHPELLDAAVELLDRLGMYGESLAVLRQKADIRSEPEFQRRLARRLYQSGLWADAAQRLAGSDANPAKADVELLAHRAMALLALGDRAHAAPVIQSLSARKGERSAAAWADVLSVVPQKDALPDDRRILETCREALKTLPENPYFHLYLGDAFARLNEGELAVREWQSAAREAPAWPVPRARLMRVVIATGRPGLLEAADGLAALAEHDADALALAVWARATAQPKPTPEQTDELLKLADRVQALRPGEPLSLRLKVHLLSGSGEPTAAREFVERQLAAEPPLSREALLALAGASEAAGLGLEAACLDRCEQAHGNSVDVATIRARQLVRDGKVDDAMRAFESTRAAAADRGSVGWQLAAAHLREGAHDPAASQAWHDVAAAHPDNPLVQCAVMSARSAQLDRDLVRRAIDVVGGMMGNEGVAWRIADARWILQGAVARGTSREREQDLVKAASILNEIVRRYPENYQARLLLGDALANLGKKDAAVEHLSAVAAATPDAWPVSLQLASLLQSLGDFEKARPYLERAEKSLERAQQATAATQPVEPSDAQPASATAAAAQQPMAAASPTIENAWRTLASLYGARGETAHAAKVLQRLSTSAGDGVDLALAELQRSDGTLTEETCQKLLAKPTPAGIGIVADFYASSGRVADAAKTIALLDGIKTEPGEREFVRGVYLQRTGAEADAITQLRAACAAAPKNDRAWRALVTLLLNSKQFEQAVTAANRAVQEIPDDAGFRRVADNRDLLLATTEAAPARGLAVALVSDSAQANVSVDALRIVETSLKNKETVAQVATKLRPLADRAASFAPVQNLLIDLYMAQRDFDGAWTIATRLVQLAPADPTPARRAAEALAAAGKWSQVIDAAREWRRRAGAKTREPDELLATAYLATRDFAAAERQLAPYREEAALQPAEWVNHFALYAQALVAQGKIAEAREYFSPALPVSAALREAWVTTGVRAIADAGAASEWVEAVKPFIPSDSLDEPLLLASAWVQLAIRPGAGGAQRSAAEAALADVTAKALSLANTKADHRVTLGALKEQMDDKPGAEADYRAALKLDPDQAIAQNNLAMLILRRDGDLSEAQDLATRAAKNAEHPAAPEFLETLAQIQRQLGLKSEAADSFRRTVTLRPANLGYRASLVQALIDVNQTNEARTALTELEGLAGQAATPDPKLRATIEHLRQVLEKLVAK